MQKRNTLRQCLAKILMLGCLQLSGCDNTVTSADLPGTYVADYGFATEKLVIEADGRFTQEIKVAASGNIVTSRGKWHFDTGEQDVVFDESFKTVANGFGNLDPNFARPGNAIVILPVRRGFEGLQIGLDPRVPYKRQSIP
jgi:hypothetical protein